MTNNTEISFIADLATAALTECPMR